MKIVIANLLFPPGFAARRRGQPLIRRRGGKPVRKAGVLAKIFLGLLFHTTAAYAEKIQPMTDYFKFRLDGNLLLHVFQTAQVRIDYLFALYTDDMRMGVRFIPIIAIASVREPQFEDFANGFNQYNVSVYSGETHCGKSFFDLIMDRLHAGMAFAFGKFLDDGQPLRRHLAAIIL
jgi:hypothetical protein